MNLANAGDQGPAHLRAETTLANGRLPNHLPLHVAHTVYVYALYYFTAVFDFDNCHEQMTTVINM